MPGGCGLGALALADVAAGRLRLPSRRGHADCLPRAPTQSVAGEPRLRIHAPRRAPPPARRADALAVGAGDFHPLVRQASRNYGDYRILSRRILDPVPRGRTVTSPGVKNVSMQFS